MFELSAEGVELINRDKDRYETRLSAVIPCLYHVQREKGWVSPEAVTFLSEMLEVPESHINEVLSFYTMFNKQPVGKYHVQVCCNISCAMNGGRELADHLSKAFDVKNGQISRDGKVTVSRVECLGSCGTAPMMQVNDEYYEDLTPEKAVEIIKGMG